MTYQPEQWRDFFVTVGGGAAALTGLFVVAISIRLEVIISDIVLQHRARMILAGLGGTFMRCSLVLMGGQNGRFVAIELFIVCFILMALGLKSYVPVSRISTGHRTSFLRTFGTAACYTVEMFGAILFFFGVTQGLNVAAIAMVANFFYLISGSWLLLVGVRQDETISHFK